MNKSRVSPQAITPSEKPTKKASKSYSLESLREAIEHAAHLLPSQGPITVFIHHNTLHAFEDLPFDEAVQKGARLFGCQPYLTEDTYRQELQRGSIRFAEVQEVLREELGHRADEKILNLCSRFDLRWAMLQYPLRSGPLEELLWHVAETDALRRVRCEASSAVREQFIAETRRWVMRDLRGTLSPCEQSKHEKKEPSKNRVQRLPLILRGLFEQFKASAIDSWSENAWEEFALRALWAVCCHGASDVPSFTPQPAAPLRHRDLLLMATGEDADQPVHDLLIRFCAAFLDQGLAQWTLPQREEGFFRSFITLYYQSGGPPERWRRGLESELCHLQENRLSALESIHESLQILGVAEEEWSDFLAASLLALRGWAGLLEQVSRRGDRVVRPVPEDTLEGFLAIRLLLDRLSLAHIARDTLGFSAPLSSLREKLRRHLGSSPAPCAEQRAFAVFQLAQVLSWTPESLHRLTDREWWTLLREIETFSTLERRRVFHLAYERRFCTRVLDAIALHAPKPAPTPRRPRFQAVFCIDERMESLRRHLEELAPDVETFSTAGFFFVPMYYRGAADAHFVPLCPAVIQPQHWVVEQVVDHLEEAHQRRAWTRRVLGMVSHRLHMGSRAFAVGALIATIGGVLASIPLVARTLAPRWTSLLRRRLGRFVQTPPLTRLRLEKNEEKASATADHGALGFSLEEMTDIGERVLRDIGLTTNFAPLVLVLGHGSTSLNNPHESAHDCGACGGSRGGPNARALAQILNDRRIRERLQQRGLRIPTQTIFLGGMCNTSSEAITFEDCDLLPLSHQQEFSEVCSLLERACDRNAHERCRRFDSAPLTLSFAAARQHVEARAEDLAQVRPEWGHATNAFSIVGRRRWSRGLFLDRRAFLTSYDPMQDDADNTILTRVLQAIFPVCAGINLEYYFSRVDNTGWGAGTKLPHNITGLLGVMDGAASDVRTGLPWQMVEIHKPVRLLNVIETTPEAMLRILARDEGIGRLCRNGWVHLAVIHPQTQQISVYQNGQFQPYIPRDSSLPRAASSVDWYSGCRGHLEFAQIEPFSSTAKGAQDNHA